MNNAPIQKVSNRIKGLAAKKLSAAKNRNIIKLSWLSIHVRRGFRLC